MSSRSFPEPQLRLYQTEWCPASHRVRQRLTELEIAFVALPVPVARGARRALIAATSGDTIPALVTADGAVLVGENDINDYLDDHFDEPVGAIAHRIKAEKVHRSPTRGGSGMIVGERYAMTAETDSNSTRRWPMCARRSRRKGSAC